MTKKAIVFTAVFISLIMAVPLSAKGPGSAKGPANDNEPAVGRNRQSMSSLTDMEIEHITYIRQEEKLARDVYRTLYDEYQAPIFGNISESEQRHMDALKRLIDKHGLEDPVTDDTVGAFPAPENENDNDLYFAKLYQELVEAGEVSYCDALQVGIDIENLDIEDIEIALDEVIARDVNRVLNNLLSGSYNHLNAFTSRYEANNCKE